MVKLNGVVRASSGKDYRRSTHLQQQIMSIDKQVKRTIRFTVVPVQEPELKVIEEESDSPLQLGDALPLQEIGASSSTNQTDQTRTRLGGKGKTVYRCRERSQPDIKSTNLSCCSRRDKPRPKAFLFLIFLFGTFNSCLSIGYVQGVLSKLDKILILEGWNTMVLRSIYFIGLAVCLIPLGYIFSDSHRPMWLGFAAVLCAIGGVLASSPYLAFQAESAFMLESDQSQLLSPEHDLCSAIPTPLNQSTNICISAASTNSVYWLVCGLILLAIGSAIQLLLGKSYTYDVVSRRNSAIYIAILDYGIVFGAVLGIVLAYLALGMFGSGANTFPSPGQIRFWWFGFLAMSGLLFLFGVFFCFSPASLRLIHLHGRQKNGQKRSKTTNLKDFFKKIGKPRVSGVVVWTCLGAGFELAACAGFMIYLSKYLEQEFGAAQNLSLWTTAAIVLVGSFSGFLASAIVCQRLGLSNRRSTSIIMFCDLNAILIFMSMFFLSCSQKTIATNQEGSLISKEFFSINNQSFEGNNIACLSQCNCGESIYDPVCGSDLVTYLSPCLAGCLVQFPREIYSENILGNEILKYTECECLSSNTSISKKYALSGPCSLHLCRRKFNWTLILMTVANVFNNFTYVPSIVLTLKSVYAHRRSAAISLFFTCSITIGLLATPLGLEYILDRTCLVWKRNQCTGKNECQLHEIIAFRYIYFGLGAIIKFFSLYCFFMVNRSIEKRLSKRVKKEREKHHTDRGKTKFNLMERHNDTVFQEVESASVEDSDSDLDSNQRTVTTELSWGKSYQNKDEYNAKNFFKNRNGIEITISKVTSL